ncbi:MAG: hypothetical protein U0521_00975 [Anaerolineae bacterium]
MKRRWALRVGEPASQPPQHAGDAFVGAARFGVIGDAVQQRAIAAGVQAARPARDQPRPQRQRFVTAERRQELSMIGMAALPRGIA